MLYLSFFGVFVASLCGVWLFKKYAIKLGAIDTVNARSLHSGDIPRGGGVIIVLLIALYAGGRIVSAESASQTQILWLLCCVALSVLGFLDDLNDLSARTRLLTQIIVSFVFCIFGLDVISAENKYLIPAIAFVLIWQINATNFMDGIDGLVGSQAVLIGLYLLAVSDSSVSEFYSTGLLVFCGATLGFLVWNWNGATVFLGDAGSYFIGFFLGTIVFLMANGVNAAFAMGIVFLPLLVDASLTLVIRTLKKENIFSAHRDHVYQLFAGSGVSHGRIASSLLLINAFIFVPLSEWALSKPEYAIRIFGFSCVLAAFIWYFARLVAKKRTPVSLE